MDMNDFISPEIDPAEQAEAFADICENTHLIVQDSSTGQQFTISIMQANALATERYPPARRGRRIPDANSLECLRCSRRRAEHR